MKSDRFDRLLELIVEAQKKRKLLDDHETRLKSGQKECEERWNKLLPLAGAAADITKIDVNGWKALPASTQDEILSQLTALIEVLDGILDEEGLSGWLMSKRLVGTWAIVLLAVYAFGITSSVLGVIAKNWKKAVQQPQVEMAVQEETKRLEKEIKDLTTSLSESSEASQPDLKSKLDGKKRELDALKNLPNLVSKAIEEQVPNEGLALRMVVYMGMLGGCLHLLSSLVRYVGDRKLVRSWLLYYMAAPLQGGGLALLIYLLLRVGVLAPADNGNGGIAQANIIGIYAFAGLTGMFAKAATEKLGEVFLTLFRTAKPPGDAVKEQPKAKSG